MADDRMELPPGFRFHPTDEELITHYLLKKIIDNDFSAKAMGEVDLNKVEPWDLPWKAKMGEKEWYFFCMKDKKYPTGLRTNRATPIGYWKATGKDKEIFRAKTLIGMKKTLVFYKGRAPRGEKTNWVMHEYRSEGKFSLQNVPSAAKSDWVICRVFEKSATGKKIHYPGLMKFNPIGNGIASILPPLFDSSPYSVSETVHVSCFSNPIVSQNGNFSHNGMQIYIPNQSNFQYPSSVPIQDHTFFKGIMGNNDPNMKNSPKMSGSQETAVSIEMNNDISSVVSNIELGRRSFEDYEAPSTSAGGLEIDCVWNY